MIADPNWALAAVLGGLLAIYVEMMRPGKVVPGIVGGVALLVGLASLTGWLGAGQPEPGLRREIALSMLILFAGISIYLLRIAIKARRNKRVV